MRVITLVATTTATIALVVGAIVAGPLVAGAVPVVVWHDAARSHGPP